MKVKKQFVIKNAQENRLNHVITDSFGLAYGNDKFLIESVKEKKNEIRRKWSK